MTMNPQSDLLFTAEGELGIITFNRPQARNALTFDMYHRLAALCAEPPDGVKVFILSGAGGHAFAAGTDINQFKDFTTPQQALEYEAMMDAMLSRLEACSLPTIAVLCGACTGGGAGIASACDLRLCTTSLRFGFPIARTLGNCLSAANLARLNALLGPGRVREMLFTCRLLGATEAQHIGLVSDVLADEAAAQQRARELAQTLLQHAPLTLRAIKEIQNRLAACAVDDQDWIARCYTSADFREGLDAFLSKRKPRWRGE